MKNKLFHKGFYLDTLLRIKGFSIFVFVFSSVVTAINAFITLTDYFTYLENSGRVEMKILSLFDIVGNITTVATVFVPVLIFLAFSHLYKRNESDFFETVPVNREAMAISGTLSVLTVFISTVIGSVLVYLIITIPCIGKLYVIDSVNFFLELLAVIIAAMFGSAISLVGISVTGVISSGILVAASLALIPRLVMNAFLAILADWNPMLVEGKIIPLFNNSTNVYYALLMGKFLAQETPWNYVYTAVISIILFAIALLLFKKRGSEAISHKFEKNIHRHFIAILLATLPLIYAIVPFFNFVDEGFLGLALGALTIVVFVVFERFGISKGEKNRGGICAFIVLLITAAGLTLGLNSADAYFESYAPSVDEIEYVSITSTDSNDDFFGDIFDDFNYLDYQNYVEKRAENIELRDKEVAKIVSKALKEKGNEDDSDKRAVTVKIKSDGKIHYRTVYLSTEDYYRIDAVLASNEKYNDIWKNVGEGARYPRTYHGGVYIYYDMLDGVLETMEAEVLEYGVDRYRSSVYMEVPVCEISYSVYIKGKEYSVSVPVFEYMSKTVEKVENARKTIAENEIADFISKLDAIEKGEMNANIYISYYGENLSCYLDLYPNKSMNFEEFSDGLKAIVDSDAYQYSDVINITFYSEDMWGTDYYYTFSVSESVTEEEIGEFLSRYGGVVYE